MIDVYGRAPRGARLLFLSVCGRLEATFGILLSSWKQRKATFGILFTLKIRLQGYLWYSWKLQIEVFSNMRIPKVFKFGTKLKRKATFGILLASH